MSRELVPTRARRVEVAPLMLGLFLLPLAVLALWTSLGGRVDWSTVAVAAPLGLIALGVLGLALSRPRTR